MSSPKDDDPKTGKFPPDAEYAVPTGSPDVYDPNYVPPPADPARNDSPAAEVPPSELYPPAGTQTKTGSGSPEPERPEQSYSSEWDGYPAGEPPPETSDPYAAEGYQAPPQSAEGFPMGPPPPSGMAYSAGDAATDAPYVPPPNPDDAPILMFDASAALQQAVGAPSSRARKRAQTQPRLDADGEPIDDGTLKRSKRTMVIALVSIVGGLGIAALVFLGHASSQRYEISCSASHAVAMQGRSFPPWGTRALNGPEWAPIALPANAECQPKSTEDVAELDKWYLELLIDRATATLTAKDLLDAPPAAAAGQPPVSPLDTVSAQLDQALLLSRDPDKRDQRKEITRLQGDVLYWRAAARLRDASAILIDASKQFDAANAQHPRHATDAAAWSKFLHGLADQLRAGPNGAAVVVGPTAPSTAAVAQPGLPVPVGTALPVEDGSGGSTEAPAPPDAGVPSGGVLL